MCSTYSNVRVCVSSSFIHILTANAKRQYKCLHVMTGLKRPAKSHTNRHLASWYVFACLCAVIYYCFLNFLTFKYNFHRLVMVFGWRVINFCSKKAKRCACCLIEETFREEIIYTWWLLFSFLFMYVCMYLSSCMYGDVGMCMRTWTIKFLSCKICH